MKKEVPGSIIVQLVYAKISIRIYLLDVVIAIYSRLKKKTKNPFEKEDQFDKEK